MVERYLDIAISRYADALICWCSDCDSNNDEYHDDDQIDDSSDDHDNDDDSDNHIDNDSNDDSDNSIDSADSDDADRHIWWIRIQIEKHIYK